MGVDFVDEFVEIVFVAGTEINKSLNGLIRVCGNILLAAFFNDLSVLVEQKRRERRTYDYHIVNEHSEVRDTVVNIGRLIDSN